MLKKLKITKDDNIVLKINLKFIDLVMKANGKADLYFHAYFWQQYLKTLDVAQTKYLTKEALKNKTPVKDPQAKKDELEASSEFETVDIYSNKYPFMKRLDGLSLTLTKVIINIKKFPFNEKMYLKYVNELG